MRRLVAGALAVFAIAVAAHFGMRARDWNDELGIASPFAKLPPIVTDPRTPRLSDHVVMIAIDGLGIDESHLPELDRLRAIGVAMVAEVPYPTISRPNYVTLLTGVPPADSGVRANRVRLPVEVDTAMDRAQAAHLRVATAGDFGMMPSLFARHTTTLSDLSWQQNGTLVTPPPSITWPIDEARRAPSLEALGPIIAELAARDAFTPVLVLDVDRAGHAEGVGDLYRATARATDQMIAAAVRNIDLATTTVIVVADHGHVAPGGHGGTEREVAHVPLILAGKGVRTGAVVANAHSIDVAPTVCALLGIPAPGHAEGHTLVGALQLAPDQAQRRLVADDVRIAQLALLTGAPARPIVWRVFAVVGLLIVAALLRTRLDRRAPLALIAFALMLIAMGAVTRGHFSPSYIPSLLKTIMLTAIGIAIAIATQVVACWFALRRSPDRLAAATNLALVGLTGSLAALGLVRAWFSMPFVIVPSPFWIVAVPAFELATTASAIAVAITLVSSMASRAAPQP